MRESPRQGFIINNKAINDTCTIPTCVLFFSSLINHCKYNNAEPLAQPGGVPKSRKHKYHWDGGGNGMKCSSNPELIPMHSGNSFHDRNQHHYHSPKAHIKRSRLFFCCSKKGAKSSRHRSGGAAGPNGQGHVVNARYEREHIFEVTFKIIANCVITVFNVFSYPSWSMPAQSCSLRVLFYVLS